MFPVTRIRPVSIGVAAMSVASMILESRGSNLWGLGDRIDLLDLCIAQSILDISAFRKRLGRTGILNRWLCNIRFPYPQDELLIPAQAVSQKQFRSGSLVGMEFANLTCDCFHARHLNTIKSVR